MSPRLVPWLSLPPLLLLLALLVPPATPVDRNKFRTCQQSAFCRRARAQQEGAARFSVRSSSVRSTPTGAEAVVDNEANGVEFRLEVQALKDR